MVVILSVSTKGPVRTEDLGNGYMLYHRTSVRSITDIYPHITILSGNVPPELKRYALVKANWMGCPVVYHGTDGQLSPEQIEEGLRTCITTSE